MKITIQAALLVLLSLAACSPYNYSSEIEALSTAVADESRAVTAGRTEMAELSQRDEWRRIRSDVHRLELL